MATFALVSLNTAFITTGTLGNDAGVPRPGPEAVVAFCLSGLGAQMPEGWFEAIGARLVFPGTPAAGRRRSAANRR